jgi:hypothetical protein
LSHTTHTTNPAHLNTPTPLPSPRSILLSASKPDRTLAQDLCNIPPFTCNSKGQLLRFNAPGGGLVCPGLPDAFKAFTALQSLDLSANSLDAKTSHVGDVMSKLPALQRASFRQVNMEGQLSCDMVGAELQVGGGRRRRRCEGRLQAGLA